MKQLKTASDKQKPKYDFLNLNLSVQQSGFAEESNAGIL